MRRGWLNREDSVENAAIPVLEPVVAERSVCGQPDGLEIERPADAEIARLMVAAVIGANHLDGNTRHRNGQIVERYGEVSDFQVLDDVDVDHCHGRLAGGI